MAKNCIQLTPEQNFCLDSTWKIASNEDLADINSQTNAVVSKFSSPRQDSNRSTNDLVFTAYKTISTDTVYLLVRKIPIRIAQADVWAHKEQFVRKDSAIESAKKKLFSAGLKNTYIPRDTVIHITQYFVKCVSFGMLPTIHKRWLLVEYKLFTLQGSVDISFYQMGTTHYKQNDMENLIKQNIHFKKHYDDYDW